MWIGRRTSEILGAGIVFKSGNFQSFTGNRGIGFQRNLVILLGGITKVMNENKSLIVNAVTNHLTRYGMMIEEQYEFPVVGILEKKSLQVHSIVSYTICDEEDYEICSRMDEFVSNFDQDSILHLVDKRDGIKMHGVVYCTGETNSTEMKKQFTELFFFHIKSKYNGTYSVIDPDVW